MEPHKLKRWRLAESFDFKELYTTARPGRSLGKDGAVKDSDVARWFQGLPGKNKLTLISLLGKKPNGTDEHSFYSFKSAVGFKEWLSNQTREVELLMFPTTDFKPVSNETIQEVGATVRERLNDGWTVVIVDSGGVQRSGQVCRNSNFLEDPRTISE